MSMMEDPTLLPPPPPLPIQLRFCYTEESKVMAVVEKVINSHYQSCSTRYSSPSATTQCTEKLCQYFTWHLHHHTSHRSVGPGCSHCALFETWVERHSILCRSSCGLSLCSELKKRSVKNRMQSSVDGFDMFRRSPSSSLTRNMAPFSHASISSYGETTADHHHDPSSSLNLLPPTYNGEDDEEKEGGGNGYFSGSASSTPRSTQSFEPDDRQRDGSEVTDVDQLTRDAYHHQESSELFAAGAPEYNHHSFTKNQSQDRSSSITSEIISLCRRHRDSNGSVVSMMNGARRESDLVYPHGGVAALDGENSLSLMTPQQQITAGSLSRPGLLSSSSSSSSADVAGGYDQSPRTSLGSSTTAGRGEGEGLKKQDHFHSDSAICSENDLSSMESLVDTTSTSTITQIVPSYSTSSSPPSSSHPPSSSLTSSHPPSSSNATPMLSYLSYQPMDTLVSSSSSSSMTPSGATTLASEPNSTSSTILGQSYENSDSNELVTTAEHSNNNNNREELNLAESYELAMKLQKEYRDEIEMMNNKGRPLHNSDPRPLSEVDCDSFPSIDMDWRESYEGAALGAPPPTTTTTSVSRSMVEKHYGPQPTTVFAEDDETVSEALDHRDSVREYLQGQFYLQQTYSEHVHWRRVRQIGRGGQAKCFCIEDCQNYYPLCLKEEMENKKTLDEAFICLTLARLVSDTPPYIVEFFGASILPHYTGLNRLQLFLELMPGCLQEYVYENGPLSPETTLSYSYQMFEALDYLHQELHVIHCDIKPANLLIDYNCQRLKVADFGCAELLDEARHRKTFPENRNAGTLWYNPPEFYSSGSCCFGMDIWQAGCSILYMVTGRRPWRHLCMDADKQRAGPGLTNLLKRKCTQLIGEELKRLHPLPAFLSASRFTKEREDSSGRGGGGGGGGGDAKLGVRQLLSGCLRQPAARLSAKDLAYLAAVSEATNIDQRSRIVKELGYSPSHDILERLQRENHNHQPMVDVYLGNEMLRTDIDSMPQIMLNGWLGSIPFQPGMTYGDLYHLATQHLPVTQNFGECALAVGANSPLGIWKSVGSRSRPHRVRPDQLVDPSHSLVLLPLCIQTTCC